jgi:hypothetical protein
MIILATSPNCSISSWQVRLDQQKRKQLFVIGEVPDYLLSNLESRDVALWVRRLPKDLPSAGALVAFLGLPWRLILVEGYDAGLIEALEAAASFSDPMTRKRGYVQIIDSDPSRIELPHRCLPLYLLDGRQPSPASDFQGRLRRMTMLEELRRSGSRQILIVAGGEDPVPPDLDDLWASGFRSNLAFVSDGASAEERLERWLREADPGQAANLLNLPSSRLVEEVLERYQATYPEDRQVIRVRDQQGTFRKIDVTEADEPERPILERYSLIEERDLAPLVPEELSEEDFVGFFRNPQHSWRPYAAGLPWLRDTRWVQNLQTNLDKLDSVGPEENFIAYISSEPGAGGTTLVRALAWRLAQHGYPVLVAKPLPFVPDALPVVNFMNRVLREVQKQSSVPRDFETTADSHGLEDRASESNPPRYEAPWVIVFDSLHWEDRDSELVRFRNELEKSGRPACLLAVTGTVLGLSFFNTRTFRRVAELNHSIPREGALELGHHLNQFLRVYGKERQDWQWDQFHEEHTVRYLEGQAAFWVTLSFWIQGQYNLFESIQEWMYRSFKEHATDRSVQDAILEIAALSSERFPMPEALLPETTGKWPVAQLLEDSLSSLGPLGLVRISEDGGKYWALIHDILGRFLVNALFYDFPMRDSLGFAEARDAEHLRFLLLRRVSQKGLLAERAYQSVGEDFATSVFKIDPDHGHGSFTSLWREVLQALDRMPQSLRDTSRVFRHHTAVSRRRVAKLDGIFYSVTVEDQLELLTRAIEDITYALTFIEYTPGSESNLNLYNSLANAYFDLADVEIRRNAPDERISELRQLANDATRSAYDESPTNSFVIETFVKNLLQNARHSPQQAVAQCVEALGILFSALTANETTYRASQLSDLADQALNILFRHSAATSLTSDPQNAVDVLLNAWKALTEGRDEWLRTDLSDAPRDNQVRALELLTSDAGRGNLQVIRMRYDLTCLVYPYALKQQLEFVEQLQAANPRGTPQLRLEYAILLYQNSRAAEGDKVFFSLRRLWRESEHFVVVPERLRWLLGADARALQTVHALSGSDYGNRAMARVQEFGNSLVPFRPEEHGIRSLRPGLRFACHVSFGHNGPFLRPVTTGPTSRGGPEFD